MTTPPGGQGWRSTASVPDPKPWFRQFWPWFLIALPATAVVAGITTLFIAMHDPDGLVADDYYKAGLAINRVLQKEHAAHRLGIEGDGRLDLTTGDLFLDLKGQFDIARGATLRLVHATRAHHDQSLEMKPVGAGRLAAQLRERLPPGSWTLSLEPADGAWRVTGRTLVDGNGGSLALSVRP